MNYQTADAKLQGRNYNSRKLAANTYLLRQSDCITIKLWDTEIMKFFPEYVEIDVKNWFTKLTKDRLNDFVPFGCFWQDKNQWYYSTKSYSSQETVAFKNGMKIWYNGRVSDFADYSDIKTAADFDKAIKAYVNEYITLLFNRKLSKPGPGDCFYCLMQNEESGKSLGELTESGHIISHIKEKYYVPSLVCNAVRAFPISTAAKNDLAWCFKYEDIKLLYADISKQQIKSSLLRFVRLYAR